MRDHRLLDKLIRRFQAPVAHVFPGILSANLLEGRREEAESRRRVTTNGRQKEGV